MLERHGHARRDALEVVGQQVLPEIPGCRLRRPRHAGALVGAEQHALPLLAHVDLGLEVDDVQLFLLVLEFRQVLGDEVLVLHREDGQLDADHAADFARPQAACVDHVLGVHRAFLGHDVPAAVRPLAGVHDAVLAHDFGARHRRRLRVGVGDAVRIDVAFDRIVHRAEEVLLFHQRIQLLRLGRRRSVRVPCRGNGREPSPCAASPLAPASRRASGRR